jgi:hypothetical protein
VLTGRSKYNPFVASLGHQPLFDAFTLAFSFGGSYIYADLVGVYDLLHTPGQHVGLAQFFLVIRIFSAFISVASIFYFSFL